MHDHDPLFEPIGAERADQAQQTGNQGASGQSGPNSPKTTGGPWVKSSSSPFPLGGIGVTGNPNPTILVLRDAVGGMGFVGPFPDEDLALDYVKMHGLSGIYWVLVTELQAP